MRNESMVILGAALVCLIVAMLLRSSGSRLYNRSAGVGLVLIVFPASLAAFGQLQWLLVLLSVPLGLSIWMGDLFARRS
ncbi:hypothetical protein DRQ53_14220 [bacterium]|nr:MAG: hypothetical protein DRQ53_14220 [bacterium]